MYAQQQQQPTQILPQQQQQGARFAALAVIRESDLIRFDEEHFRVVD
jgi:hypothetical protein